jgi:hypothetical protein
MTMSEHKLFDEVELEVFRLLNLVWDNRDYWKSLAHCTHDLEWVGRHQDAVLLYSIAKQQMQVLHCIP